VGQGYIGENGIHNAGDDKGRTHEGFQNRISTRRAVALAYISQLLLRTLPAIEHQEKPADDGFILVDIPCAVRDRALAAQNASKGQPLTNQQ
jgi:hypothetical protein